MEAEALLSEKDEALLAAYESLTTACRERAGLRAQLLRVGAGGGRRGAGRKIAHRWACVRAMPGPVRSVLGGGTGGRCRVREALESAAWQAHTGCHAEGP